MGLEVLFALVSAFCLLTVPLAGGRLLRLGEQHWRWASAAVMALLVQILIISVLPGGDGIVHEALHLSSYVIVGAVVVANRHIPYLLVVGAGGALNFLAIAANGGVMPASHSAVASAGRLPTEGEFLNSVPVADAHLAFLGDVFAIPGPYSNVFSAGDVLMAVGAFLCVHAICGSALAPRRWRVQAA